MDAYVSTALAAIAAATLILLPFALRSRVGPPAIRESAWRDRLPLSLVILGPFIRGYSVSVDKSLTTAQRETIQGRLDTAGAAYLIAPAELVVLQRIAVVVGAALALYVICALHIDAPMHVGAIACLAPCAWLYPSLWLRDISRKRQRRFEKEFPFFLDILVLGMRAGLTFTASLEQALTQLRDGPVKDEFSRYLRETRSGAVRRMALDRLAARVAVPAMANFTASVAQAEETGGSLGDILADQARQRRQERFTRAEKLANQAPVKMLFPLIALLFPVTFIIIGFPIAIQLREAGALEWFF
jgi:tight adherence protein C